MQNNLDIIQLFDRYINGECSPEEVKLLLQLFDQRENEAMLKSIIQDQLHSFREAENSSIKDPEMKSKMDALFSILQKKIKK